VAFTPPLGTTTYTATSDDTDDCPFSVDITVNPIPTVDGGSDVSICEGDSVMLAGTGTADTYTWDGGVTDGMYFTPPAGTTTYTVTGETTEGCESTDEVDVTYTVIDMGVSAAGATLTSDQAGATYQWIDCADSSAVAGETNQNFTVQQNGNYAVIVTIGGCTDTSACETVSGIGISETSAIANWKVYPNPTSATIIISSSSDVFVYEIFSVLGQVVISGQGTNGQLVDMTNLPDGAYLVRLSSDKEVTTVRVVKK
jgi:hypothetical protein